MPPSGTCWWHLILTARGQWLPGDPRGFRSRRHRLHSSGDYQHRPPTPEHAPLHRYHRDRSGNAVQFPDPIRVDLGRAILIKIRKLNIHCLCLAVGPSHTHLLLRATHDYDHLKKLSGQLKQAASHTVRTQMPGRLWADGGKPIRVKDRQHQLK
jgi:hypothetical protein